MPAGQTRCGILPHHSRTVAGFSRIGFFFASGASGGTRGEGAQMTREGHQEAQNLRPDLFGEGRSGIRARRCELEHERAPIRENLARRCISKKVAANGQEMQN